ncbi:MAG: DUF2214 family protein [Rhodocyclaceae bacterium]
MSGFLLPWLHFLAIGGLVMVLFGEWATLRGRIEGPRLAFLLQLDLAYMLFAGLVLATGLARVFAGDKPGAYYGGNPVFHAKMGLFVLIGLISIVPTLSFFRWRKAGGADEAVVARTRRWVTAELLLLPLLPLCGAVLARGW